MMSTVRRSESFAVDEESYRCSFVDKIDDDSQSVAEQKQPEVIVEDKPSIEEAPVVEEPQPPVEQAQVEEIPVEEKLVEES